MQRVLYLVLVLCLFSTAAFTQTTPPTKSLIRIDGLSVSDVRKFASGDFDIARTGKTFVEMVVDKGSVKSFRTPGQKVSIIIPDLDAYVAKVQAAQLRGVSYYTYETMTSTLKTWSETYKNITRLESLGKTFENRDIWAIKVSDNPEKNEKEPAALVMGAHHAREWISVEVPMGALKQILEGYGNDEKITKLVNEREIWFVPMVNPDGVFYSQNKSRYWRKNRFKTYGVDLNRNYGYKWGNTGSSNSTNSDTYHGTGPFSEAESSAIKMLAEREKFQASLSFHSYSELVLFPFGYAYNVPCEDTPTLSRLAGEMAKFNGYTPENSAELYPAMGDSDDYLYGEHKALAFTIELATTFIPDPSEIAEINKINVPAVLHLIDKSGTYAVTTPSAEKSLIAELDFEGAMAAIVDGTALSSDFTPEAKVAIDDNLSLLGKRAAELTLQDLLQGKTSSLEKVKATPEAGFVYETVKDRVSFECAHGQEFSAEILAMVR